MIFWPHIPFFECIQRYATVCKQWYAMAYNGVQSHTIVCNGMQSHTTVHNNGMQSYTMVHNGMQRYAMVCNGMQRYTNNGMQSYTMVHNRMQWYATVCDCTLLYAMVCKLNCGIFATKFRLPILPCFATVFRKTSPWMC